MTRKVRRSDDADADDVSQEILALNERLNEVIVRLETLRIALQTRHGLSPDYYDEIEKIVRQALARRYKTGLKAHIDRRTDEQLRQLLDKLNGPTN